MRGEGEGSGLDSRRDVYWKGTGQGDALAAKVRVDVVGADEARSANRGVEHVATAELALVRLDTIWELSFAGRNATHDALGADAAAANRVNVDRGVLQAKEAGLAVGKPEAAEAPLTLTSLDMRSRKWFSQQLLMRGAANRSKMQSYSPTHGVGLGAGAGTTSDDRCLEVEDAHEAGLAPGKEVVSAAGVAQAALKCEKRGLIFGIQTSTRRIARVDMGEARAGRTGGRCGPMGVAIAADELLENGTIQRRNRRSWSEQADWFHATDQLRKLSNLIPHDHPTSSSVPHVGHEERLSAAETARSSLQFTKDDLLVSHREDSASVFYDARRSAALRCSEFEFLIRAYGTWGSVYVSSNSKALRVRLAAG
ncbi:hypothetical protein BDK51DRAFT_50256 [Blyttiomyces helicus]|uniref:Uncharacterized protein n=1 Tax=Blyttiomyces helicus TaxID=388810 RepID=A0A4P9VU84_9FUNG|nr:hypothetical protein BDK51DRAFT_50256 [Blyttiomyces helicus]|eukprot:RKO83134.1 hypothetical protein BDK51DRAFT_50256 [Blyttiomyces helicus]